MKNIEENNKLIAEFMNVDHVDIDQAYEDYGELKYHTSWDWLMPVVEKIESLETKQQQLEKKVSEEEKSTFEAAKERNLQPKQYRYKLW